jgi:hypothetical protein
MGEGDFRVLVEAFTVTHASTGSRNHLPSGPTVFRGTENGPFRGAFRVTARASTSWRYQWGQVHYSTLPHGRCYVRPSALVLRPADAGSSGSGEVRKSGREAMDHRGDPL